MRERRGASSLNIGSCLPLSPLSAISPCTSFGCTLWHTPCYPLIPSSRDGAGARALKIPVDNLGCICTAGGNERTTGGGDGRRAITVALRGRARAGIALVPAANINVVATFSNRRGEQFCSPPATRARRPRVRWDNYNAWTLPSLPSRAWFACLPLHYLRGTRARATSPLLAASTSTVGPALSFCSFCT